MTRPLGIDLQAFIALNTNQRRRVVALCAEHLAKSLGRTPEDVIANGLNAGDFPADRSVTLKHPDGSVLTFEHAFFVKDEATSIIAIFSEHMGYHLFRGFGDLDVTSSEGAGKRPR